MRTSMSRFRWSLAPLGLALLAYGCDAATEPASPPVSIVMVSGDDQEGTAGETLGEPFAVRVTDAAGEGVYTEVTWTVTSGSGEFRAGPEPFAPAVSGSIRSRLDGSSRVYLQPKMLGTIRVTADVPGLQGSPVTFTTEVTGLLIQLSGVGYDVDDPETCLDTGGDGFIGPDGTSRADVLVGTTVKWTSTTDGTCQFHIKSTRVPPGGEHFDSATFSGSDSGPPFYLLEFVPGVPGTWEYVDEISGATGTLTAR